jgi:hypothetical protein
MGGDALEIGGGDLTRMRLEPANVTKQQRLAQPRLFGE